MTAVQKAPSDYPGGKQGDELTVEFTVLGIPCLGLNGGPQFKHSEAFSFQVATQRRRGKPVRLDTQEETDGYWNAIVGSASARVPGLAAGVGCAAGSLTLTRTAGDRSSSRPQVTAPGEADPRRSDQWTKRVHRYSSSSTIASPAAAAEADEGADRREVEMHHVVHYVSQYAAKREARP